MKPAVFLDRDGTLIKSVHYLNKKEQVELIPGVADTLQQLHEAGFALIIVTNQAAIGKGLLSVEGLHEIQAHFDALLAAEGAAIDAWYFCDKLRTAEDREAVDHPDRKPGPGMLLRAAQEHHLDLSQSWMVGDMVSDTLAGRNAHVKATVLVKTGLHEESTLQHPSVDYVIDTIADLAPLIQNHSGAI